MSTRSTSTLDDRARGLLPLSPILMHILLALVDRPRHGLGIADHVEDFSNRRISLGPGTLYTSIKRLLEQGLIAEPAAPPPDDSDDPRRRYYAITALGRRTLELDVRELANVLRTAKTKGVL
jgi:DNA-binding PadR family transcriptional regulator